MDAQRNSGVRAYQKGVCRTKDSEATASFFLANREPSFYAPYLGSYWLFFHQAKSMCWGKERDPQTDTVFFSFPITDPKN